MSIYATLWRLKFPRYGDDHTGCDWIAVMAQGVPVHVGVASPGVAGEQTDPYASFLPSISAVGPEGDDESLRAMVFVTEGTPKGTARSGQEYVAPLLVLSGREYAAVSVGELHAMICDALRGHRPKLVAETWNPDGRIRLLFEDGSAHDVDGGIA